MPQELGRCDHTGQDYGSIGSKPCMPWPDQSAKDRRTAYHCTRYVHGLPYYPRESYHVASELLADVRRLYQQYQTTERFTVAHKGGIEGIWLTTWKIPNLDLDTLGCPKFESLPRLSFVGSCAQRQDPLRHHCPQVECYHFVQCICSQRLLGHDTRYINHERTQRFLASQRPSTRLQLLRRVRPPPKFRFFKEHMSNNKRQ